MFPIEATKRHVRIWTSLSAATVAACVATSAQATVLEYDKAGQRTQSGRSKDKTVVASIKRIAKLDPRKQRLRTLARATALGHADEAVLSRTGLNASTFALLFQTLIQRESAFDTKAMSPKGAQGLGQLMPGTARDLGVSDPLDPIANLDGSARYLAQQLQAFGSVELALAAYNAGPGAVRKHGGVPPYAETQAYIAWILKRSGIARAVATTPSPASVVPVTSKTTPDRTDASTNEEPLTGKVSVWEF